MIVDVIIERAAEEFWGRIEGYKFLPITTGKTLATVLDNLKMLIEDYILNEGKNDKTWKNVIVDEIDFRVSFEN